MPAIAASDPDLVLADQMVEFYADPYGFVLFAFPWEEGNGPDTWQREALEEIGAAVRDRNFDGSTPVSAIRRATASGHGIGKSALTSWLILWLMSTRPHCKGVVTANTSSQLETKTWAELSKWHKRCITSHWFKLSTGKMSMRISHRDHPETWRCDAQTCREENSEAFAGLHAATSTPFYIFDEASAIPDTIWDVAEGGMTDGEPMWFAFGNPTRNTGRFKECFGRLRHRWTTKQIDSRTAKLPNKQQISDWIKDYGEDSDFVRVRVKGVFPRAGSMQLIGSDLVDAAVERDARTTIYDPMVMGVDVARFGEDQSVIICRRGKDARHHLERHRGLDTMQLAGRVVACIAEQKPDAVFIDETGVGGGVIDRLRQLGHKVIGVNFGSNPDSNVDGELVYNKRAEMWVKMRRWLKEGGAIPNEPDLIADLTGVEYGYRDGGEIILEKKDDMRKRGLASPDLGDALALTFAHAVAQKPDAGNLHHRVNSVQSEWDPYRNF